MFILFQGHQSTWTSIILEDVEPETTGRFRCEVLGNASLFEAAYRDGTMAVVGKLYLSLCF